MKWVKFKCLTQAVTLGLVINFGQERLIDGWKRVVNDL